MDVKTIGLLMTLIIFLLLIWVRFYRPKEKKMNQLEASYFEEVQRYRKNRSEENLKKAQKSAMDYYQGLNLSKEEQLKRIDDDLRS